MSRSNFIEMKSGVIFFFFFCRKVISQRFWCNYLKIKIGVKVNCETLLLLGDDNIKGYPFKYVFISGSNLYNTKYGHTPTSFYLNSNTQTQCEKVETKE